MEDNLFFRRTDLRKCGKNVIIGKTVRIRYPELVEIGDNVIIDDFTYISTALCIHSIAHISAGCTIIGGRDAAVEIGTFSTLAPHVVLAAGSDDYLSGLATPLAPKKFKAAAKIGTIKLGRHCIIGANSTVLPNVSLADGAALGANSLANMSLTAWTLYAGIPARPLRRRNEAEIKAMEQAFLHEHTGNG